MMLDDIVEDLIKEHDGGENFFEALDDSIRDKEYIDQLYDMFLKDCEEENADPSYYAIVVSGKFGIYFQKEYPGLNAILVNGGLRHDDIMDLTPFADDINGRVFVFLDDSFYNGRTAKKIGLGLIDHGGRLERVYVVYNGSKNRNIRSLYSYYGV